MKQYRQGDRITFSFEGVTYPYEIRDTHLSICDGSGTNSKILSKLGYTNMGTRWEYASQIYGYLCRSGSWPSYSKGDMVAASMIIEAVKDKCRGHVTPITIKRDRYVRDAVIGDYLYSLNDIDETSRLEGTIVKLIEDVYEQGDCRMVVRYQGIEGTSRSTNEYPEENFRYATHEEILASKYANEYKSLIGGDPTKSVNYEVQVKSKAVSTRHRGEAVKPRRSAVKITSASGLTGNPITSFTRRSKIGHGKVSTSFLVASRH